MPDLVIVESPNKVKKIASLLGPGYEVAASSGHFRDLPPKALGVDLATLTPTYVLHADKAGLVGKIKKLAASCRTVYLATDADREGEAISWHLAQVLRHDRMRRIRFQEITAPALKKAIAAAGALDQDLVDAQQARRVLDRLVGYQISPLLAVFGPNQSAGRVQSAALHLVCLREEAREDFVPEAFWTLIATYANGMTSRHVTRNEKGEYVQTRCKSQAEARAIIAGAPSPHAVRSVLTERRERRPKAPFTTSTLQQAGSVVLGLKPGATMDLAQKLFEAGLITYHRTDSVALSEEAVAMARAAIERDHPESLPAAPVVYKNKGSAQEAHEAIRPTHVDDPEAKALTGQAAELYDLILRRFLACQCRPAVLSQTTILLTSRDTTWRTVGTTVLEPHWLVYVKADEDAETKSDDDEEGASVRLPPVAKGDRLEVTAIVPKGSVTKPPPRYTQASLVRELERLGIGRPSTYASIVDDQYGVLFLREYLAEDKKTVLPTVRGRLIDEALTQAFPDLVDHHYTAQMETRLDEIAEGRRRWRDELKAWYGAFAVQLAAAAPILKDTAQANLSLLPPPADIAKPTGKRCPRCGAELHLREGRKGAFLSCSAYPACKYTADPSVQPASTTCPECGRAMEQLDGKFGRYARCVDKACGAKLDLAVEVEEFCPLCAKRLRDRGTFLGCSGYPACRYSIAKADLAKAKKAGKACPRCGLLLVPRKGPKGPFWGCSGWPDCRYSEAMLGAQPRSAAKPRARGPTKSTRPTRRS